jgi:Do/DeqQ family serine protease
LRFSCAIVTLLFGVKGFDSDQKDRLVLKRFILSCLLVLCLFQPAFGRDSVPQSAEVVNLSFAPVVRAVAPAVVNVYATRMVRTESGLSPFFNDPMFRRFFGDQFPMPEQRRQTPSLGSGVVVSGNGLILTNHHVIKDATEVKVILADGREFVCEIVLRDERTDLALMRMEDPPDNLPFIAFGNSDDLQVGDLVLAIGNPFGVGQTVTQGIVSALARTRVGITDYQFFIQTDAAINPGNSGGALVNIRGELVGINTAIYSRSGGSNGIGFAIPSNMAEVIVRQGKAGQSVVRRPWLGAGMQNITADIANSLGLDRPSGALVRSIVPDSPAEEAGLRRGDVILAMDGQRVSDPNAFGYLFSQKPLQGSTKLLVLSGGREKELVIALKPAPETVPRDEKLIGGRSPFSGVTVMNLSPAVAEELSIAPVEGVIIADVTQNSVANRAGLRPLDIILNVNGQPVSTTRDLDILARQPSSLWRILLERNGQRQQIILRGRG